MTVTTSAPSGGGEAAVPPEDLVSLTIDGVDISVPKGTLVIRAAEQIGVEIPRFCDHPLLDPVGACRQCIVEVEGQRKPMASCTITCTDGMVVKTHLTSPVAEKAQKGVMELLLINHPLDCPVCDKGGECPLQNQAMSHGHSESRFEGRKRTYEKPVPISTQVLLDRERCVLCARCTRFSNQVAGDPMIELVERGALQQVGTGEGDPFESYFSGNTIQICPVGALTSAAYRFRSRPFDLVSSPSVCEHCSGGCATRTDHRRGKVMRRLAANDPEVNEEWICDKGRFAFRYAQRPDRLTTPLVRNAEGVLEPTSWPEALEAAARGLLAARGRAGVLTGGRLTVEDAYAYSKFARVALDSNDIDFRARVHSGEEADFLAARVAGRGRDLDGTGVTYAFLEKAPAVLLVGFEAEEEAPGVFLRLRKAWRGHKQQVFSLATHATRGLAKAGGTLLPAAPGTETEWLDALASGFGLDDDGTKAAEALRTEGAVIVVGERFAAVAGGLTAAVRAASLTGAKLVWIPRRAGERAAVEAGALPSVLPGGRPATDPRAREEVAAAWGVAELPSRYGRDTGQIVEAAATGELGALVVAGVELADLPDPRRAREALSAVGFLVSLELRPSEVTERADVVLPVAAVAEKAGTFINWEGRVRMFEAALKPDQMTRRVAPTDGRVLQMLADAMDVHLGLPDLRTTRAELDRLGAWDGARANEPVEVAASLPRPAAGEAVLAGHRLLLDQGRLQDGDDALAGTRHAAHARVSAATAAEAGVKNGDVLAVSGPAGVVELPLQITEMPDRVVWLPLNSTGTGVASDTGALPGALVRIGPATLAAEAPEEVEA
ncbi:NADH-quinone oxidoreductase subunit G [Streptomyces europaeiscabiei]|uniref:NADH-quinone oxidoreductase subunit G n=1 Tax=Streptomyces europaeiscabiei TaxID=146819 RepID=UPI0029B8F586|nr:NADH-quinone oxidoreductase subunit G [Streptomyces europaeiscabiei]MDX2760710.1 NADH-quinone oxidoreductase subunit G [Streptomyces europaeiscabiei]MDX3715026.1 NADH-quinone oxidoreductase subunit G [Streptomyces europaeiscabiei]MDX3783579.1 NADH-quinone oxidoreductase subunit G [Streptomyces europaeiscabiei]MDX3838734.1 NADH-quinone oxidoreductase subunit G [Streptomyces europaeiscabiei]MDX3842606.1 NADH-quinone oxidoreductase subunit G [Streptomyces europaeiscabiei]